MSAKKEPAKEPNVTWVMGTRKALARSIAIALAEAEEMATEPLNVHAIEGKKLKAIVERAHKGPGATESEMRIAAVAMNEGLAYRRKVAYARRTQHAREELFKRALDIVDTMIEVKAMGAFQHPWREPRRGTDDDDNEDD